MYAQAAPVAVQATPQAPAYVASHSYNTSTTLPEVVQAPSAVLDGNAGDFSALNGAAPTVEHQYSDAPATGHWAPGVQGAGCDTCGDSGYPTAAGYGCSDCGADGTCLTNATCGPKRQWFAGFYGLYLQRDNPGRSSVAFLVEDQTTITTPYYPVDSLDFFFTSDADVDGQWGGEVRFGSTFGAGCGCSCHHPYAWEVGYWGLAEDDNYADFLPYAWEVGYWGLAEDDNYADFLITETLGPTTQPRIYGMKNFAGLEYDRDGAGATWAYRPLNDYFDYQVPVNNPAPDDIRVVGLRVRQQFEIQNLELSFWKFGTPTCSTGCLGGGAACGVGAGSGGAACGCDPCAQPCRPPRRFFINGLCGVRYMRIDEDLFHDLQFALVDGTGTPVAGEPTSYTGFGADDNVLFYDIEADNQLVGFQLGCSMNWLVGCKWNFFADSNFGVYGNQIDTRQRVFSPGGGTVRLVGTGEDADFSASDEDIAFLGEARLGVGYQLTCNCRATAAFRVIAISGVALAVEQIPADFSNATLVEYIDSNDSIVLHGVQTGLEWKY